MEELFNRIRKIHNLKGNEVTHQNVITQSQIIKEIQDLQDAFSETKDSERYYAMEMLKNRISTFNTKEKRNLSSNTKTHILNSNTLTEIKQ